MKCWSALSLGPSAAAVFAATLAAQPIQNAEPRLLRAAHIAGTAPKIDGLLDDSVWKTAEPVSDFVQREPNPGKQSAYTTIAKVAYDDDAVYVALRMIDPEPAKIISRLTRRDDFSSGSDRVGVFFDSYHDRRTAFAFIATPRGAQADLQLFDDVREDGTWDAVWEVKTGRDALGWTAEFRIPLSQLRYGGSRIAGTIIWGLQFVREHGRSGELSFWSPVPPNAGRTVSLFGELHGNKAVKTPRRLEVVPYTLTKLTRAPGVAANPFYSNNSTALAAGADIKYGVSSSLTLTTTINPDFGQVEADPSVVNLGSFETFFPEKRPFFTEGSDIFRSSLSPEAFMFYSRRIGRSPQAAPSIAAGGFAESPPAARILAAAKLSGKTAGGWGIGALHAVTEQAVARVSDAAGNISSQPVEPLTNYSVVRLARDFRNGRSGVGFIGTSTLRDLSAPRLEFLRDNALTSGVNWFHRFGNNQYQTAGWFMSSAIRGNANAINAVKRNPVHRFQRPDASHITFDTTATSMFGWGGESSTRKIAGTKVWTASVGVRSPGLDMNDVGFQSFADLVYTRAHFGYRNFQPGKFLRSWVFDTNWIPAWTFGGTRSRNTIDGALSATAKNLSTGYLMMQAWLPATSPWDLRGGPAIRLPMYSDWTLNLSTSARNQMSYEFSSNGTWFREKAGYNLSVGPRVTYRPNGATTLSLAPRLAWNRNQAQYIRTSTVAGTPHYIMGDLHQITGSFVARGSVAISPRLSFDLYAQPFVSGGTYRAIKEVTAPLASAYHDRYTTFGAGRVSFDHTTNRYSIDLQPDGKVDFTMANPNFNVRQLRSNAVMRWEYRPGSTIYLVWTQARDDDRLDNGVSLDRDFDRLFSVSPKNILLLKVSYWLTP